MQNEAPEKGSIPAGKNSYRISLIDRFLHFHHEILDGFYLGRNRAVLVTRKSGRLNFILKFWYPGNLQYHAMDSTELETFVRDLEIVRKRLAG